MFDLMLLVDTGRGQRGSEFRAQSREGATFYCGRRVTGGSFWAVELTKVLHEHDELLPRDLAALELWHLRLACALHHADCREERLAINKEW